MSPQGQVETRARFVARPGLFAYAPPTGPVVEWHVNFADPHLFVAYGSVLLAQDELQVAEHPILGSLYEALDAAGRTPSTLDDRDRPRPVTITGVQRRCAIDTLPRPEAGRPHGLYGNAFGRATERQILAATSALAIPTISNILAMAALPGGYGEYNDAEIRYILNTAYTGFCAARQESERLAPSVETVIHTGFWGCGAFGGNRTLMTILQSLAADLAGVELVLWAFDDAGIRVVVEGRNCYETLLLSSNEVNAIVRALVDQGFAWGASDGN